MIGQPGRAVPSAVPPTTAAMMLQVFVGLMCIASSGAVAASGHLARPPYVPSETLVEQVLMYGSVLQPQQHQQQQQQVQQVQEQLLQRQQRDQPVTGFFEQKLDHYDPLEQRTWRQKFYINAAFEPENVQPNQRAAAVPIYMYIGGEGMKSSFSTEQDK